MLSGISALVVYSYKIFRSRVYAVGMVWKIPALQTYIDESSSDLPDFNSGFQVELKSLLDESWLNKATVLDLNVSQREAEDYLQRIVKGAYTKRRRSLQPGRQQDTLVLRKLGKKPAEECEETALEEEVIQHGEALKLHSKQFEEIEKRIRRLEIESVQKLQEATEEKPRPPQVVQ